MRTDRILHGAGKISLQAAVHPKCTLGALNMKEEEEIKVLEEVEKHIFLIQS